MGSAYIGHELRQKSNGHMKRKETKINKRKPINQPLEDFLDPKAFFKGFDSGFVSGRFEGVGKLLGNIFNVEYLGPDW